jgi:hypothetical protein
MISQEINEKELIRQVQKKLNKMSLLGNLSLCTIVFALAQPILMVIDNEKLFLYLTLMMMNVCINLVVRVSYKQNDIEVNYLCKKLNINKL